MSRFREIEREARQFGQEANLSHLKQRVDQLEAEVQSLASTIRDLTERLEKLEAGSDQPKE